MRLQLKGGAYTARSRIAACSRSINYYPEKNSDGSAVSEWTLYQAPGLLPLVQDGGNKTPVRQVYRASNDDGYCVIGQKVYYVAPNWALTELGALMTVANTPVYFSDNGIEILLVDGSSFGYKINLTTRAFAQLEDPDGFFEGGGSVDEIDGFLLWSVPETKKFKSTLNNQITPFDLTYVASKSAYADALQRLIINRLQIVLLGKLKSEIWYDVGGAQFPFARVPGTYIEHGTCAPYSAAASDISVFWLGQDLRGVGYVFRQRGYDTKIISNYAVSLAIRRMGKLGQLADAIGFTYTQDGHEFYMLQFPSGNQTWVFDDSIEDLDLAWHQRCWTDVDGTLNRDRSNCATWLYGKNVVGDWENGTLYSLDLDTYTDTVDGVIGPKSFIRTFPHIALGQVDAQGAPPLAQGTVLTVSSFAMDMECGEGADGEVPAGELANPVTLRATYDRGKNWNEGVLQTTGANGQHNTQPKWGGGAGSARDIMFEISHSINGPAAINGAWIKATVAGN